MAEKPPRAKDIVPAPGIPEAWKSLPIRAVVTVGALVVVVAMALRTGDHSIAAAAAGALVGFMGKMNGRA